MVIQFVNFEETDWNVFQFGRDGQKNEGSIVIQEQLF